MQIFLSCRVNGGAGKMKVMLFKPVFSFKERKKKKKKMVLCYDIIWLAIQNLKLSVGFLITFDEINCSTV